MNIKAIDSGFFKEKNSVCVGD